VHVVNHRICVRILLWADDRWTSCLCIIHFVLMTRSLLRVVKKRRERRRDSSWQIVVGLNIDTDVVTVGQMRQNVTNRTDEPDIERHSRDNQVVRTE